VIGYWKFAPPMASHVGRQHGRDIGGSVNALGTTRRDSSRFDDQPIARETGDTVTTHAIKNHFALEGESTEYRVRPARFRLRPD
jgi:hypothetical protein